MPRISEISPGMVRSYPQEDHTSVTFRLTEVWVEYLPGDTPTLARAGIKVKKP